MWSQKAWHLSCLHWHEMVSKVLKLHLTFLICKMGELLIPFTWGYGEDWLKLGAVKSAINIIPIIGKRIQSATGEREGVFCQGGGHDPGRDFLPLGLYYPAE